MYMIMLQPYCFVIQIWIPVMFKFHWVMYCIHGQSHVQVMVS
jgi:hypothetical protein